jgi:hypothetical protein
MKKSSRRLAIDWWNGLTFEEKFFKTIKNNELIVGDKTRHLYSLTGREIETIWKSETKTKND